MAIARPPLARRGGMTLIELMVVIAIVLLMASVAIPILTPNDDQKGREAALTATTAIARAVARAEANGPSGGGLWLEPLDPDASGTVVSRGILDLFACQSQDDYQGDDPGVTPRVFVQHMPDPPPPGRLSSDAILMFSTLTSANIRVYCQKASRIQIPRGGDEYYFRLLTVNEQRARGGNPTFTGVGGILPPPYRASSQPDDNYVGYYIRKPLSDDDDDDEWRAHNEPLVVDYGGPILAEASPIPPATSPPPQSSPGFEPGRPQGAVFESNGSPISPPEAVATPPDSATMPAVGAGDSFTIRRPITRSATPPLSLPAGFGIDLAWSTYGNRLLAPPPPPSLPPRAGTGTRVQPIVGLLSNHPVCFMFSQTKDVVGLVYHRPEIIGGFPTIVEERLSLSADVYLLVGRLDRAGLPYRPNPSENAPGANWQYPDSRWVKISRTGGSTLIADPVLGVDNVYDSQQYARLGLQAAKQ